MRKINPGLMLLLFLVVIAAMLNFLAASQHVSLAFYFLPTLYSAYHFGRKHATFTALASMMIVVLLVHFNPAMLSHKIDLPFDPRWVEITVWGGVLILAGYATGTLHERNEASLREMEEGYDGMLVILQSFLASQKHSDAKAYRISTYAAKIGEHLGFDSGSIEDIRTAALLFNLKELRISTEMLQRAALVSDQELRGALAKKGNDSTQASVIAGSLRRAIPIFLAEQQLSTSSADAIDAAFEVQILHLAEAFESLVSGQNGKIAPAQAREEILKRSSNSYDSLIIDAFSKAFGAEAKGAGA